MALQTKLDKNLINQYKIAVVGLGYVGLPLAYEFAKQYKVVGFDINTRRVEELVRGYDCTFEIDSASLMDVLSCNGSNGLILSSEDKSIKECNIFIITVPTPVDKNNDPDLTPLFSATQIVAAVLKPGDIVIYESTVYPGLTEEECVPILQSVSGLQYNKDFFAGYSPERINPGDKQHTFANIVKITSGSTPAVANIVDSLYQSVIKVGTYKAPGIKIAEAAKVIENAQRDVNIAFVNELARIFNRLNIDTQEVLKAASTKWNFLNFKPGLAGGHCVGVDSYYLAYRALKEGYSPNVLLASRRLNDDMGKYIADEVVKLMAKRDIRVRGAKLLILGLTFKENCPDIRNTKVVDIIDTLSEYDIKSTICDPWADPREVEEVYGLKSHKDIVGDDFDGVIIAVAHNEFRDLELNRLCKATKVIYDVKGILNKNLTDARL